MWYWYDTRYWTFMTWLANEPYRFKDWPGWSNFAWISHFNTNLLVMTQQVAKLTTCKQISIIQNSDNVSCFHSLLSVYFCCRLSKSFFIKCVFTVFFQWNFLIAYSQLFSQVFWAHFSKISSQVISQVYSQVLKSKFLPILFTCFFTCFFTGLKIHRFFHRFYISWFFYKI